MDPIMITMRHVRAASIGGRGVNCAEGVLHYCRIHDIDIRKLLVEGLPISQAEKIDDAYARRVVQIAREEAASHG